jgi:hypothetical protein
MDSSVSFKGNKFINPDEFVKFLKCPLTGKIFHTPVLGENGIVYEMLEYYKSVKNKANVRHVVALGLFVKAFIEAYPEYKTQQYQAVKSEKLSHLSHQHEIRQIIIGNNYKDIMKYHEFVTSVISEEYFQYFIDHASMDVLQYFIKNCVDPYDAFGSRRWSSINWICNRLTAVKPDIIKFMVDTGMKIDYPCGDDGWTGIHQIIHFSKDSWIVKYIIDKNFDLFLKNNNGITVLEFIVGRKNNEIITYVLSKINMHNHQFIESRERLINLVFENSSLTDSEKENLFNTICSSLE